jgi:hypothetical protein
VNVVNLMAQAIEPVSDSFGVGEPLRSDEPQVSLFGVVLYIGLYALTSYLLGRIFAKAGEKPWKAWVPIYNTVVLFRIGGYSPWWILVPFANAIVYLAAHYKIGKSLGKSGWFVLLALFLYPVWLVWLALDGSTWNKAPADQAPAAPEQNPLPPTPQV